MSLNYLHSARATNRPTREAILQNAMYRFELDGLQIAHMGDIGNPLNDVQTRFLKDVDVLLALVGAGLVISLPELKRVIDVTGPRIVIPMHFRTLCYTTRDLHWIPDFSRFLMRTTLNLPSFRIRTSRARR